MSEQQQRIVCWFSAGDASAVATKLVLAQQSGAEICVARIHVAEEDPDNDRFAADCAAWFRRPIISLRSGEWDSCEQLWEARRYMSGPKGAICTGQMKKAVRWQFEADWRPTMHIFGITADDPKHRAEGLRAELGERVSFPLILAELTKKDCHAIVQRAGLVPSIRYRQGFANANCRGCVKAESPGYWNRERRHNPDVFARRAKLSRSLGVRLVRLTKAPRERIFLDELSPDDMSDDGQPNWDCSIMCEAAETQIEGAA